MRNIILSLLLATTAIAPAIAAAPTPEEREAAREERKSERTERAKARAEKPEASRAPRTERADSREGRADARQQRVESRQERVEQRPTNVNERNRPTLDERRSARDARIVERTDGREQRQESRSQWQQQAERARQRTRPPAGARPDRPAPPPQVAVTTPAPRWATTWKHDNRYDWRRYRDRNRSLFRLGFYYDPFGWSYNRWNIGWRLWPSYYDRHHWLSDPWMYRLPYAPWPYQWIRYWDDALLVNTITGEVVDAEYNFFW